MAERLVLYKLRPPHVVSLTGISKEHVRRIWREIHKESPKPGLHAVSCANRFSRKDMLDLTLFHTIYDHIAPNHVDIRQLNVYNLVHAYELYLSVVKNSGDSNPPLDFTDLFYYIRDVKYKTALMYTCRNCGVKYFHSSGGKMFGGCPCCAVERTD